MNNEIKLSEDFKSILRHFAYYYTNGSLGYVIGDETILEGIDYREDLKNEASLVEQAYAIFSNNIQMDENGKVLNASYSMKRAAQWIRDVCKEKDDDFTVIPDFEDWELELY